VALWTAERGDVLAEDPDVSRGRPLQQDHLAQQHRFARAAAAGDGEDLASAHVEIEIGVHGVAAETGADLLHLDHELGGFCGGGGGGGGGGHVTGPGC